MITSTHTRSADPERTSLRQHARRAIDRALRAIAYFNLCLRIARERRQLRGFDARTLKDIGLSQADAMREADRGFWDIPDHRRAELTRDPVTYSTGTGSVPLVRAFQK